MKALYEKKYFNIYVIILALNAALLPTTELFEVKALSFASVLLLAWYLLTGNWKNRWHQIRHNKFLWLFTSLYLVNLITIWYSDNSDDGSDLLVRKLPLLLLPVIIATAPRLSKGHIHGLLLVFVSSMFLISLYTFREGVTILLDKNDLTNLLRLVPLHRPYLGMYSVLAFLIIIHFLKYKIHWIVKSVALLLAAYFLFYTYAVHAKMAIVALAILSPIIIFIYVARRINIYLSLLMFIASLIVGIYLIKTNDQLKTIYSKITTFEDFSYEEYNIHLVSSINIRYINWGCSLEIIKRDNNWLTGLGVGAPKDQLLECYERKNPWIFGQKHNAHNEYLEEMLRNGIVGFGLLFASLAIAFGFSIYYQKYLYTSFILLFALCCIAESMLSRQAGIMFYAFFNSIFMFSLFSTETKKDIKTAYPA
ncbi:O-antigen ligase family protein [Pontibacter sp. H249]|uniref:O-antigen ligase family protein n=1 Tax=Pontibacter sp. H249 TaxID=3133420 RepID=UPI0030BB097E